MPRPASGQVIRNPTKGGFSYALRFRAYGSRQYVTLGAPEDGWTEAKAERELAAVLRDVDRGLWQPPQPDPAPQLVTDPTFLEFASDWLDATKGQWRASTVADYTWRLESHLLPFLKSHRLRQITVAEVDRYREAKVREGRLSPRSINMGLTLLGQILDLADERELIDRNPLRVNPKRRRLRASKPARAWLDRAEQVAALLDAAGELDREARADRQGIGRRAMLATLTFAGLRIGELCALRWRDVDLAAGRLRVAASKTDAGVRYVELLPVLRDLLAERKAMAAHCDPDGRVFATTRGRPRNKDNVRNRVFAPAVERANTNLAKGERTPLPEGLTPHGLRHSFASLLLALGEDPRHVMGQLGHTDPAFTLRLYTHAMSRDDGGQDALRALVRGADWAVNGQWSGETDPSDADASTAENEKTLR